MLDTAALACLKHSARAALVSTFAASAGDEQSDGEKSSRTEHGRLLEGNYAQRVWWPGTS
jgi:hypothetical protein